MEWMLLPLKRYADFSGRSRRKEYWMFTLMFVLAIVALSVVTGILGAFNGPEPTKLFVVPVGLLILALFVPTLAVQVRRFHDQDKSGWLVLLGLIPYIGGIIVLVFMCIGGTRSTNRFGPDPKDPGSEAFR
jgi:uncharacterized membrane protein YhaH (DUF805 family)